MNLNQPNHINGNVSYARKDRNKYFVSPGFTLFHLRIHQLIPSIPYFRIHITMNTDSRFTCKTCDTRFVSEEMLRQHMRAHEHPEKQCKYCNKAFIWRKLLRSHVERVHSVLKKEFRCGKCDKTFQVCDLWSFL